MSNERWMRANILKMTPAEAQARCSGTDETSAYPRRGFATSLLRHDDHPASVGLPVAG